MNQKLLSKTPKPSENVQQSSWKHILLLYQNYQKYKILTKQFHKIVFYILVSVQIVWIGLTLNITTLNHYNYFIDQFLTNFNQQFKQNYLTTHPGFNFLLEDVNSFDTDYSIICWLIWISHVGFQIIFGYIVFMNRIIYKQFKTGFKQMLPIFFSLLTTFVIRDCLLMSVTQIIQSDLIQVQTFIQHQHAQFLKYDGKFLTFIYTSLIQVEQLITDFTVLKFLTYLQQICDLIIIGLVTVQVIRIYVYANRCIDIQREMKLHKQFQIQPISVTITAPNSQRHPSQFSKFSQQRQYSTAFNHSFLAGKNMIQSHKQIGIYSHKQPLGNFSREALHGHHHEKEQLQPNIKDIIKKSKSNKNLRKLNRSGSCNYLKESLQIDQIEPIGEIKINKQSTNNIKNQNIIANDNHYSGQASHGHKLKLRKHISLQNPQLLSFIHQNPQPNLVKGQKVIFQV